MVSNSNQEDKKETVFEVEPRLATREWVTADGRIVGKEGSSWRAFRRIMHSRAVLRSIKGLFVLIADNTEHCAMQSRGSENIYFYTDIEMDSRVFEQQWTR